MQTIEWTIGASRRRHITINSVYFSLIHGTILSSTVTNATSSIIRIKPVTAWGPEPDRIAIVNPDDLKNGIVRRRAVYRWNLTERPDGNDLSKRYALQKIAANGGTHFPF